MRTILLLLFYVDLDGDFFVHKTKRVHFDEIAFKSLMLHASITASVWLRRRRSTNC